mgnify:CR=1 FL=1
MPEALERGVSADDAADVHRPSDPPQPGLRELARSQSAGRGAEARSTRRRARTPRAAALEAFAREPAGAAVSDGGRRRGVAPGPTSFRSSRFRPTVRRLIYTTNALENVTSRSCARSSRRAATSRTTTRRRSCSGSRCATSPYNGPRAHRGLGGRDESIRDSLRRPIHQARDLTTRTPDTEFLTLPS